jgi:hypothetical protein
VLATVQDFADRAGAERVAVLLDRQPPTLVERLEDATLTVTEGETTRVAAPDPGSAGLALPTLRAVPASAISADPDTGELAAPIGSIQLLRRLGTGAGARARRTLGGDRYLRHPRSRDAADGGCARGRTGGARHRRPPLHVARLLAGRRHR